MTSNTPETQALLPVTQADRDAAADFHHVNGFGPMQSRRMTADEMRNGRHDRDPLVKAFARHRISHSLPGDVGMQEPWPGCYADLHERRVTTLAKLGLMLSVMASGEAAEVVGYDAADLYAEVLMALAIEDADDTDIALEEARDHPDSDIMAVQATFKALASLSTPTAEPMGEETLREEIGRLLLNYAHERAMGLGEGPAYAHEVREAFINRIVALTTPPTPDRIGKDAVREALKPFADKASMCDFGSDDYCPDWSPFIPVGAYRNAARALSATHAQPVDETERLRALRDAEWMNLMPREVVARAALNEGCRDKTAADIRAGLHSDVKIRAEVAVKLVASIQEEVRAALTDTKPTRPVGDR